jgi:hypothetical protein
VRGLLLGRDVQGEAGLTNTPGTNQGQEPGPILAHQVGNRPGFALPADQRAERRRHRGRDLDVVFSTGSGSASEPRILAQVGDVNGGGS